MPTHPQPIDLMRLCCGLKALPEVGIDDGFAVGFFPAALLPAMYPFLDAFLDILAVCIKRHRAGAVEAFERNNRAHKLHAVVGGLLVPAKQLFLAITIAENRTPTAGAWIARTRAICVDYYGLVGRDRRHSRCLSGFRAPS